MCVSALVAASLVVSSAPAAADEPPWAPVDSATIRPGVQVALAGEQCTSNFVFYDAREVYLGTAGHCVRDWNESSPGCGHASHPLGARVEIQGATRPGTIAYVGYLTMQDVGEENDDVCYMNDFALLRLHPDDRTRVNPSVPVWGGPTGLRQSPVVENEKALAYGNSSLRGGIDALKPLEGTYLADAYDGWAHEAYMVTPGIPNDSGSGFMDGSGNATGLMKYLEYAPNPGSTGVTPVNRALDYLHRHTRLRVRLALGTESFAGPRLGPGLVESPPPEPQPTLPALPDAGGPPAPRAAITIYAVARRANALRRITGTATGAVRVQVAVVVRTGRGCRVLASGGRFIRSRGCRTAWVAARGTGRWSLPLRGSRPHGRYAITARALDASGGELARMTRTARVR